MKQSKFNTDASQRDDFFVYKHITSSKSTDPGYFANVIGYRMNIIQHEGWAFNKNIEL